MIALRITETKKGLILEITVKPRSKTFKVTVEPELIVVFCREEPVEGKVNKEIVKEFSRLFHRRVKLVSGFASRRKVLFVEEAGRDEIERILGHVTK